MEQTPCCPGEATPDRIIVPARRRPIVVSRRLFLGGMFTAALAACSVDDAIYQDERPGPAPPGQPPPGGPGLVLDPDKVPDPDWAQWLIEAAEACGDVDAPTLAAQIEAESNWNPDAVSPVGAQGLCQFMPATWAEVGVDANGDGIADPFEPQDAIATQGVYMCTLYGQVRTATLNQELEAGRELENTLAAYNAGLGAVLEFGGIPPYPETLLYVPKIMTLRQDYALAGGGGEPVEGYDPAPVQEGPPISDVCFDIPCEYEMQPTGLRGLRTVKQVIPFVVFTSAWRSTGSVAESDHPAGLAFDAASTASWDSDQGRAMNWFQAHWLQVNADRLDVKYIIFANHRWPGYAGEDAWVPYQHKSGGGGPSLDHHDHYHVSFNATAGDPDAPLRGHAPKQGSHPRGFWIDPADALGALP